MTIRSAIQRFFSPERLSGLTLSKIQGDASSRQYFRLSDDAGSFIVCLDPCLKESSSDTYPFLVVHTLLSKHDLPVPAILGCDMDEGVLLLEDCGDILLQDSFGVADQEVIIRRYRQVIDTLVSLQSVAGSSDQIPFSLSFDQEKLMFEFDFFIEHAVLNYFSGTMPAPSVALLRKEFAGIAQLLVRPEHFVLNHRDFHSRNILLYHDTPYLIDFQDARMGLPQYDAVSLLRDSYITLDDSVAEELKRYHYDALVRGGLIMMSFDEYLFLFDVMAFQRNIKALGTFCYQTAVLGKPQYEVSIAPTLAYLSAYIARRKELEQAGTLLLPLLEGDRS